MMDNINVYTVPVKFDFYTVTEVHGLFLDALLKDRENNLVFGSFWGSDTAIRDFQGRLTLGLQEGGMNSFYVETDLDKQRVQVQNIDQIDQQTGRVRTDIYGDMVHCILFAKEILKPDMANHRAILISRTDEVPNLWNAVKLVCPVPLLDHWQGYILPILENAGMIHLLRGINQYGVKIEIDEDKMAEIVKAGCITGRLTIENLEAVA